MNTLFHLQWVNCANSLEICWMLGWIPWCALAAKSMYNYIQYSFSILSINLTKDNQNYFGIIFKIERLS